MSKHKYARGYGQADSEALGRLPCFDDRPAVCRMRLVAICAFRLNVVFTGRLKLG